MRSYRSLRFVAALCIASLVAPAVYAQPTPAERTAATEAYKRGVSAADHGDYEKARVYFVQAHSVDRSPKTLWSLAVAEKKSGHVLDALKHFRAYVADPSPNAASYKDKGKAFIAELQNVTGRIRIDAPKGWTVRLDQAEISNEDGRQGMDVLPGKHQVEAGTEKRDVQIAAGQEASEVFAEPVANVAPPPPPPPSGGPSGPSSGGPQQPVPSSPPSSGGTAVPVGTWIAGGVAVVGLGAGIGFGLAGASKKDDYTGKSNACADPSSAACSDAKDARDGASRDRTISYVAYGVAGAALATGIVLWVLAPREREKESSAKATSPRFGAMVAPGAAGIDLRGSF